MLTYSPNTFIQTNEKGGNQIIQSSVKRLYHKVHESPYSIKIALSGKEHYKVNSKALTISSGHFLLVNSGESIECTIDSKKEVEGKCIYIDNQVLNNVYNSVIKTNYFDDKKEDEQFNFISGKYNFDRNDHLSHLLNWFIDNRPVDLDAFYHELSFQLILHQKGVKQVLSKLNSIHRITQLELYHKAKVARAYINENYQEDISIDEISKEAGVSKFHLIRVFKKIYGITPYNMLVQTRLNKATELLLDKDLSIEEIALITGFKQRRTFTHSFKNEFGFCPSDKRI
ncbi:AraC family transcriptional regulator [uncultured Psychroserpens sp.]|uniref:helix-turn-helix domain-containing protein n=1 Tax=uncultured Psychroserpens sp. TaxID=255436 RepID=UPI00263017BC|nr:AraC family transcriptional regulator [uncultured Psychroserpens sp.]